MRTWIADAIDSQPGMQVVGLAGDGMEAAARNVELRPDVITMDLRMPGADGFAGIARIMAERPAPILVVTAEPESPNTFRALSLGALDFLSKPSGPHEEAAFPERLGRRLRLLADTPVIRHVRGERQEASPAPSPSSGRPKASIVAIAASLGGPRAMARLLRALPEGYRLPIVVVQHMADGFTTGLVRWLRQETGREVHEAEDGEPLVPGRVLYAPAGRHIRVLRDRVRLDDGPPQHGFRPSATPLFRSIASAWGEEACGVILTGMGDDGADGLRALHDAGGYTLAQSRESCAVFGMPRAAIEAGAVREVLPLEEIAVALAEVAR